MMKWKGFRGTAKVEGDSDEDYKPIAFDEKKDVNGSKPPKKQSIIQIAILAWLLALTILLGLFVKDNSKTEERIAKLEKPTGKVSGKIIMPESDVITDLDKRIKKLETTPPVSAAGADMAKTLTDFGDRLKQVEDRMAAPIVTDKGASPKEAKSDAFKQLQDRIDRLEGMIAKLTTGKTPLKESEAKGEKGETKTEPKAEAPKSADTPSSETKETPKTDELKGTEKAEPVLAKADRKASAKSARKPSVKKAVDKRPARHKGTPQPGTKPSSREVRETADRGFLTGGPYGGYRPSSSSGAGLYDLGSHYDSLYENASTELRSFSPPVYDEAMTAGKIIHLPMRNTR